MNRNYGFLSYQKIRTTSTIDCFLKVNNSSNLFLTSLNLKENNVKKKNLNGLHGYQRSYKVDYNL